ncbi:MAG: hypothetical protein HFJ44_05095 [Clostridia bacterium]|jgi:hypothetical protein|nr:hypothetical protein [Clostridia bacterium]
MEDKTPMPQKNGIRKRINDAVEFIKSKINRNYTLSEKSPDFLKQNKKLILNTIRKNCYYLDEVPDYILLEELSNEKIPENEIIDTALKRGYQISSKSNKILLGEEAKKLVLEYIGREKDLQENYINQGRENYKVRSAIEALDESIFEDVELANQITHLAIQKGYKLSDNSPNHLKNIPQLAENYYQDLLNNFSNDIKETLRTKNILSAELIKNKEFIRKYIKLLKQKEIPNDNILESIIESEECMKVIKENPELMQNVFDNIGPNNLEKFFNKFFSKEELQQFFSQNDKLQGSLLRISKLYNKDDTVLETLDFKMLDEKYETIPDYKMQIIAKNEQVQKQIIELSPYKLNLYNRMTQVVNSKTNRWNRFEENILNNLSDGYYDELIDDLYEQAQAGNKITQEDIETLTFLFSKRWSHKRFFHEQLSRIEMDEKKRKELELNNSNNVFNITSKKELEHFSEIKEVVCNTVLYNPKLDDEQMTEDVSKYLSKFKQLSEIDRVKLALLEKYYNMDLNEAECIVSEFATDIEKVTAKDKNEESIIEQIKAVKNIFESNDIETLQKVAELDYIVETDLSTSTFLIEQSKEMYEKRYKEKLYSPSQEDKIGNTAYNGNEIEVFDANTDFSMIVKRVGSSEENSQDVWNSLTKAGDRNNKVLRYYTCASYMTDENLLKRENDTEIILGFGQGCEDYSFDAIYQKDAHTPFYTGDSINQSFKGKYTLPETLETETDNNYNEVVINTLNHDENGNITKMQPDYIVYVKERSHFELEDIENDPVWIKTKKAASEFGVPIIIVDREKVKESEKNKIKEMSDKIKGEESSAEVSRFVKKVEHYSSRYGNENIQEHAPKEKIDFLKRYAEEKRREEDKTRAVPQINSITNLESTYGLRREDVMDRQSNLKAANAISGGER